MPRIDGFETLRQLRSFSAVPVIILTARGADADKIRGLTLGADDYLQKPFNPDELVARIEAVRRRLGPVEQRRIQAPATFGDITIDFEKRKVAVRDEEVYLNRTEWLLLSELARNPGRLMFHRELLTRVWGPEYRDDVQLLRTWISRLRRKLERNLGNPELIRTVPKSGYILK
jgi:two-component system KDP operon response regulator KdpE